MEARFMMRGITLYEPYASLISIGAKTNETRPRRTNYRGDICIHAALKTVDGIEPEVLDAFRNRAEPMVWKFGCIVAVVDLWDVQPSKHFKSQGTMVWTGDIEISAEELSFGNYASGRWIYRTRNLRRLTTPIPCKGFQCVGWTVPPEIEAQVRAQLENQDEDSSKKESYEAELAWTKKIWKS